MLMTSTPVGARAEHGRSQSIIRVQTSLLAPVERRCLIWLAHRMPPWVTSDRLTTLAFVAMIGAGACYAISHGSPFGLSASNVCLAMNWFGDSLDGTLARVRALERPRYGYYVDHLVDAVGAAALFGGLALSGLMTPIVALAVLVAYFLVCIEVFLATCATATFTMSYAGIGPTELRLLLVAGNLAAMTHATSTLFGHTARLFDIGGVISAASLLVVFATSAVRHTRELYVAEPLPTPRTTHARR